MSNMSILSPAKSATLTIKLLRWLFIWTAVRVATRLHESAYVETVYGKKQDPPNLNSLVTNFAVILLLFHVALLAIVNTMVDSGAFPKSVKTYALTESVAYMIFIILASLYIASLVQTKRYFNYRKDGLRAVRAYKEMVLWTVFPISVSPIFFTT